MTLPSAGAEDDEDGATLMAEINVTPFVDVMLVLLIIFMATAPLMMAGVPLHLPKSSAARLAPVREPVVISLDQDGHAFLGADAIADADLPGRLRALAGEINDRTVYLRADRALPYGDVMRLIGTMAAAGLAHISLLSAQTPAAEKP